MGFIKYSAGNVRTWEPIISAYSRGQFGLSRGAIRLIGLSDGDSIVLFFDEEKGLMAMRKAEDKEEGAVSLSFRQDGSSAIASAKGFFSYHNILPEKVAQYIPDFLEDLGLYVLKPRKK